MKLKDLLTTETWNKFGDMDVTNDVSDDLACAWCGETLTEEGRKKFEKALELEAEIAPVWGSPGIVILVDKCGDHWEREWTRAARMFADMAGYCTEEEYDAWFKEEI